MLGNQNHSPVTHSHSDRRGEKNPESRQFDETVPKKLAPNPVLKDNEEIAVLKANHAIEISQYHQTIQQLNRKILALTH
jgi:hypothetical protein